MVETAETDEQALSMLQEELLPQFNLIGPRARLYKLRLNATLELFDEAFPRLTVKNEQGEIISHPVLDHYSQRPTYVPYYAKRLIYPDDRYFPITDDRTAPASVKIYEKNGDVYYKATSYFCYARTEGNDEDTYSIDNPTTVLFKLTSKGFEFISSDESDIGYDLCHGVVDKDILKKYKHELSTRPRACAVVEELPPLTLKDLKSAPASSWIGQQLIHNPSLTFTTNPTLRDVLDELKRESFSFPPHSPKAIKEAVDNILNLEKLKREYQPILKRDLSSLALISEDLTERQYAELERISKLEGDEQDIQLSKFNREEIKPKLDAAQQEATLKLFNDLFPGRGDDVLKHLCQYPAYFHVHALGHASNGLIVPKQESTAKKIEIYTEGSEIHYKATSDFTVGYKKQSRIHQPCEVLYKLTEDGWTFSHANGNRFVRDVELGRTKPNIRTAYRDEIGLPADEAFAREEATKIEQAIEDAKTRKLSVVSPSRAVQAVTPPVADIATAKARTAPAEHKQDAAENLAIGTCLGFIAGVVLTVTTGGLFGLGTAFVLTVCSVAGFVMGWAKNEIEVYAKQSKAHKASAKVVVAPSVAAVSAQSRVPSSTASVMTSTKAVSANSRNVVVSHQAATTKTVVAATPVASAPAQSASGQLAKVSLFAKIRGLFSSKPEQANSPRASAG